MVAIRWSPFHFLSHLPSNLARREILYNRKDTGLIIVRRMAYSGLWRAAVHSHGYYALIQRAIDSGRLIEMILSDSTMSVADQAIELVRRLNDPRYAAGASVISRELQEIQLSDQGWAAADAMLDHADPNINFYGALSLQIKLNKNRSVPLPFSTHEVQW